MASAPKNAYLLRRDLALLNDLLSREPLAIARKVPPTVRANVRWPPQESHAPARASFSAVAPLVMHGERLPENFHPLPSEPEPHGAR